jgi:hypothetical protein
MCDRQDAVCDGQNIKTGGTDAMRTPVSIEALARCLCATVGPARAQGLRSDRSRNSLTSAARPRASFSKAARSTTRATLWFVGIGSGWISYLQPDGKLVPVVNCNPPQEIGQTCEPQRTG